MKNVVFASSIFLFFAFVLSGCSGTKSQKSGNVTLAFKAIANGKEVKVGDDTQFTNAKGQLYKVNLLRYYLHGIKLVDEQGTVTTLNKYFLVDQVKPARTTLNFGEVAGAKYNSISFNIGVDKTNNSTGTQEGDLDPVNDMFWTWSSGYIFFKHEGAYSATNKPLLFHFGTDDALVGPVSMPLNNFEMDGKDRTITITLNLDKLYNQNWDFDVNNFSMSGVNDAPIIAMYKANIANAFTATVD